MENVDIISERMFVLGMFDVRMFVALSLPQKRVMKDQPNRQVEGYLMMSSPHFKPKSRNMWHLNKVIIILLLLLLLLLLLFLFFFLLLLWAMSSEITHKCSLQIAGPCSVLWSPSTLAFECQ